ncbi:LysR family transcriptional regulator [Terrarubrum flagellatum]|uniref:LysR family transcriptional regulator n=1 Tax=Terrirubrum flagellatum TaxID=2895980 RepID=UPI003144D81C
MADAAPGWELYRTLLGVLREGSLSGAARALGLTQPTVGRHLDALEASLGAPLFVRSQHGVAPTDLALELRPYAEALQANADALLRAAGGHGEGVRGTVRITASEIIGAEVLPPIIAAMQRRYPDLTVELVLSNRLDDLLQREADVAVRMTPPTQQALVAKRIGAIELGLHARRDYLDRRGTPTGIEDLRNHLVLGFDTETAFIRSLRERGVPLDRTMFSLRTDSDLAQLASIRAGCGIGVCQVPIARRDPALVRILADAFTIPLETWIVMHENLRSSARCRAAFDALVAGLAAHIATQADERL